MIIVEVIIMVIEVFFPIIILSSRKNKIPIDNIIAMNAIVKGSFSFRAVRSLYIKNNIYKVTKEAKSLVPKMK